MNGQKNRKTDKCSFRKKQPDKHFEKKQNAVLRNRASKNEWANFSKKKQMQFEKKNEYLNGQTLKFRNRKMQFGQK